MYIKNKKGQSTVEYVLLVTAVIAVMVAFATSKNGGFQGQLNTTLTNVTNDINAIAGTLSDSHQLSSPSSNTTPPYTVSVSP